jgi:hypothetical protein
MPDLVHVGSTTSAAIKDANKIQGISRWLVLAKPLPGCTAAAPAATGGSSSRDRSRCGGSAAEAEATALPNAKAAALDRSLLLFKLLGNLHYWSPELPQQLQQRFVKLLVGGLRSSARSEAEFTVACHRVTLNLQRLVKFLEPVSPDEDTADDEGDLLVNQLEIDLIADLRKSVAKLAISGWRDALPAPPVSLHGRFRHSAYGFRLFGWQLHAGYHHSSGGYASASNSLLTCLCSWLPFYDTFCRSRCPSWTFLQRSMRQQQTSPSLRHTQQQHRQQQHTQQQQQQQLVRYPSG